MRSRTLAAAVLTLAFATAGCAKDQPQAAPTTASGTPSPTAPAFTDQLVGTMDAFAENDMLAVKTMHVAGTFYAWGDDLWMDMDITQNGDCFGKATLKGGEGELLSSSGQFYMRGDKGFYTFAANAEQADDFVRALGDKWFKLPAEASESMTHLCDPHVWLWPLLEEVAEEKGEVAEVNGVPAVELTSLTMGVHTSTWVAIEAPHYVLKVTRTGGDEPLDLTFSDFNKKLKIKAPPAGQVFEAPQ